MIKAPWPLILASAFWMISSQKERHKNVIFGSLAYSYHFLKISSKSNYNLLRNFGHSQINAVM